MVSEDAETEKKMPKFEKTKRLILLPGFYPRTI